MALQGSNSNRKVVLGLGNILNRDEGMGIHAMHALEKDLRPISPRLEFIDGGVQGLNLLPLIESCDHLLVLDSIDFGRHPGTLIALRKEEIPLFNQVKLSPHQVSFQEVLALAQFRGKLPTYLRLIGIQPANLSLRVGLSPVVAAAIPQMIECATRTLRSWGLLERSSSRRVYRCE